MAARSDRTNHCICHGLHKKKSAAVKAEMCPTRVPSHAEQRFPAGLATQASASASACVATSCPVGLVHMSSPCCMQDNLLTTALQRTYGFIGLASNALLQPGWISQARTEPGFHIQQQTANSMQANAAFHCMPAAKAAPQTSAAPVGCRRKNRQLSTRTMNAKADSSARAP